MRNTLVLIAISALWTGASAGNVQIQVLDRDGKLMSSVIGHKTERVICAEQGSQAVEISDEEAAQSCLSDAMLGELGALMRRVEAAYQFPQDIEWGIANDRLYLLQSRPVTTIPAPRRRPNCSPTQPR